MIPASAVNQVEALDPGSPWRAPLWQSGSGICAWDPPSVSSPFTLAYCRLILTSCFSTQQSKRGQPCSPGRSSWGGAVAAALPGPSSSEPAPALRAQTKAEARSSAPAPQAVSPGETLAIAGGLLPGQVLWSPLRSQWSSVLPTGTLLSRLICPPAAVNCGLWQQQITSRQPGRCALAE